MSQSKNKMKKDILKSENEKKKSGKYDYESDFSLNTINNKEKTRRASSLSSMGSTVKNRKRSRSRSGSRSRSKNRSRSRTRSRSRSKSRRSISTDSDRSRHTKTIKKNNNRKRSISPTVSPTYSNNTSFNGKTTKKNPYISVKATSKASKRSSESCPAPDQRKLKGNQKKTANVYMKSQRRQFGSMEHLSGVNNNNEKANRIISAQRHKNNDLLNRITEITTQLDKLKEENKLLKRVHVREENALKKLESQDVDVNRIMRNYSEEIQSLKQKIRKHNEENRKLNSSLIERDDEIRALKKKYSELKDILNDKKLIESAELSKKLEQTEKEFEEFKSKYQTLERKLEINEKNHKHEIGVEIAHHKETQKQLQKLNEELRELKVKVEEKDRAIESLNIYSRPNRETNPSAIPLWKMSSNSINSSTIAQESPHDKRKEYDKKVKEKQAKQKKDKLDSDRRDQINEETNNTNNTDSNHINKYDEEDYAEKERHRKIELDKKREDDLRKKELEAHEQKEREEKDRLEKLRQQAIQMEIDKKRKEDDEKEKRLKEIEQNERKKRWTTSEINEDSNSKAKKDDLLAKLFSNTYNEDSNSTTVTIKPPKADNKNEIKISPIAQPLVKTSIIFDNTNNTKITNASSQMNSNSTNQYKFTKSTENLHEGKPAIAPRSENDSQLSNNSSRKDDLLSKLFGNTTTSTTNTITSTNKNNDIFKSTKATTQNNTSSSKAQAQFLPFEIPDAQYNTSYNKKPPLDNKPKKTSLFDDDNDDDKNDDLNIFTFKSTNKTFNNNNNLNSNNNTLKRPKENNSVFTSNRINPNTHSFIEDIEELTL